MCLSHSDALSRLDCQWTYERRKESAMRVFLAGGTGAIGQRLVPQLVARGHDVTATTRDPEKAELLFELGATPVLMDGLDGASVGEAVAMAQPEAIIHEMTALGGTPDFKHFDRWFAQTNRLRTEGTEHLLAAAMASGVRRFVAQSYTGWTNARSGSLIKTEADPFEPQPAPVQRATLAAIQFVEEAVTSAPLDGIVLRYGSLYGPGASEAMVEIVRGRKMPIVGNGAAVWSWLHVDDAAAATIVAVEGAQCGIFNIVDDEPAAVSEWLPYLAEAVGARRPMRVPVWIARFAIGDAGVRMMTE